MNHEEFKIHKAILAHVRSAFPQVKIFHIANESRDATQAFWNKELGVEPGASDFVIAWKGSITGVGVLEVKSRKGKLTTAQNKFLSAMHICGWHTGVVSSVRGAHLVLCSWGLNPKHTAIHEPDLRTVNEKFKDARDFYAP